MQRMGRHFIACGKGRSVEDSVWRQCTKAEAAVQQPGGAKAAAGAAGGVLLGVRKCYENFNLETLERRALALQVPAVLVRLCAN